MGPIATTTTKNFSNGFVTPFNFCIAFVKAAVSSYFTSKGQISKLTKKCSAQIIDMKDYSINIRVGLIWSTLRYQFGSGTIERTMSEDSKNVIEISVAIIQTRHGPLKATASTL